MFLEGRRGVLNSIPIYSASVDFPCLVSGIEYENYVVNSGKIECFLVNIRLTLP